MITSVKTWGNSQAIRVPKDMLKRLGISVDDELDISIDEDKIIIEKMDKKQHKTLMERFAEYDGDYEPTEINWGESVGKEIW